MRGGAAVRRRPGERGSGTLLMAFLAMLVLSAGLVAVLWGGVSAGRHRAAAAADLAALSAAQAVRSGAGDDPCRTARRIAAVHGAELVGCRLEGETVEVVAGVEVDLGSLGSPRIDARARAGPVGS